MIKAFSQRLSPPYSGMVQIAESDQARALTMDGKNWDFHFLYTIPGAENSYQRRFSRSLSIDNEEIRRLAAGESSNQNTMDERILELARYIAGAKFPFAPADKFEFWLLDPADGTPLAYLFSCAEREQMDSFRKTAEWTALPDSVMKVTRTDAEEKAGMPPVNYRLERLVAERAGNKPQAQWFERRAGDEESFPSLLLREDWQSEEAQELSRRYLDRQSPRLLMLHGLSRDLRSSLEMRSRPHVFEVERFHRFYPEIVDDAVMKTILVEARLRECE